MYRQIQVDQSNTPLSSIPPSANSVAVGPFGYVPNKMPRSHRCLFNGNLREAGIDGYLLGNGYRLFDALLMRFLTPDRWSPFGRGGINAYAYCNGDPVNGSDPSGRFWVPKPGTLFRWKVPLKIKGSVEANAFEQAYASFGNLNWRQRVVTSKKGRSNFALDHHIELDAEKEALLADLGVFGSDARHVFEGHSFQWRSTESLRENARKTVHKTNKQRSKHRVGAVRDDPVQAWHRRQLFQHLPDTDGLS